MNDRRNLSPSRQRVMLALVAAAWLAGCASPPSSPSSPSAAPASTPAPPPPRMAAAATAPAAPAPPVQSAPAALSLAEVTAALRAAQGMLQEGDADAALELVQRVLAVDPGNGMAASYLRQIEGDPMTLLGRDSYAYTVKPGESVSSIARDRLRDTNLFYALARYNNIRVPRLLSAGQIIRIPGRAPAAAPPPPAASIPTGPAPEPPSAPPSPSPSASASASAEDKTKRVNALLRQARGAFARQDLCGSIRVYDHVLELDPNHQKARSERQRSVELIERLRKQGGKAEC